VVGLVGDQDMKLRSVWLISGRVVSVTFSKASMGDASPLEFVIANADDRQPTEPPRLLVLTTIRISTCLHLKSYNPSHLDINNADTYRITLTRKGYLQRNMQCANYA
jgi:hypothetical protein